MKKLLILSVILFLTNVIWAQSKKNEYRFSTVQDIQIDGDLTEWGQLHDMSADTTWSFAVAKDEDNLYFAVRIINPMLQLEAARNGVLVNINVEGKKKDGVTLIFPIPDGETVRAIRNDENLKAEHVKQELIARSRGFQVKGFPLVVDGLLSYENSYGIHAVAKVDDQDIMVYESVIPIAQLKLEKQNKPIAIQVAVNNRWSEMQKAMSRANQDSYARYRGMMGHQSQIKMPFKGRLEAWVIDKL